MSNRKAVQTLGMSQGTACNRLRKMVLFRQLQKYEDNICVRCGQEIESADELSIEHIQPWEGRSADLFWDLDNIAFSHLQCNMAERSSRAKYINVQLRKIGPEGTSWCSICAQFKPVNNFSKGTRWNGLDSSCKECKDRRNALRDRRKILLDSSNDRTQVP